jgi:hypothetical protein
MIFIVLCYSHPVISMCLVFTRLEVNKNFVFVTDAVYQKLKYSYLFCFCFHLHGHAVLGLAHNTNGGATLHLYHFHCSVKILPISKATSAKKGPAKG